MDGDTEDYSSENLVNIILSIIDKDTTNKAVMREVELLSAIEKCERRPEEPKSDFVDRFNGAVGQYVNQNVELNELVRKPTVCYIDDTSRQLITE